MAEKIDAKEVDNTNKIKDLCGEDLLNKFLTGTYSLEEYTELLKEIKRRLAGYETITTFLRNW